MRENNPAMNHLAEQFAKTQAHYNYQRNDRMYQGNNNHYPMERHIRRCTKCNGSLPSDYRIKTRSSSKEHYTLQETNDLQEGKRTRDHNLEKTKRRYQHGTR